MKCNGLYIIEFICSVIIEKGIERCKYYCIGKICLLVGIFFFLRKYKLMLEF